MTNKIRAAFEKWDRKHEDNYVQPWKVWQACYKWFGQEENKIIEAAELVCVDVKHNETKYFIHADQRRAIIKLSKVLAKHKERGE